MTEYTRGRATTYKGVRMRSRLEASFAAWLDGRKIPWEYEAKCFADETGQYLPDFCSNIGWATFYYEVKPPTADTSTALRKMHVIHSSEPQAVFFVVVPTGIYPNQQWTTAGQCLPDKRCAHCTGTTFRDERTIPSTDRKTIGGRARRETVPVDSKGRAVIGGRARRADGTRPMDDQP